MKKQVLNLLMKEVLYSKYRRFISWNEALGRFHKIKKEFNPRYGTNFWAIYEPIGQSLSYELKYIRVIRKNGPIVLEILNGKKIYHEENFKYMTIKESVFNGHMPKKISTQKKVLKNEGGSYFKKEIEQKGKKYLQLLKKGKTETFFKKVVGIYSLKPLKTANARLKREEKIKIFNELFGFNFQVHYERQADGSKKIKIIRAKAPRQNGKIIFPGEPIQLELF